MVLGLGQVGFEGGVRTRASLGPIQPGTVGARSVYFAKSFSTPDLIQSELDLGRHISHLADEEPEEEGFPRKCPGLLPARPALQEGWVVSASELPLPCPRLHRHGGLVAVQV